MSSPCELCVAVNQNFRLVKRTSLSFAIICKAPLKPGHLLVLPIRHVERFSDLTSDEAQDILSLMDKLRNLLVEVYGGDCVVHKNYGLHSSQKHLHFHLLPSKGNIGDWVSKDEGILRNPEVSDEALASLKKELIQNP